MEAQATRGDRGARPGMTMINQVTQYVEHTATLLDTEVADGTFGVGVQEMQIEIEKAYRLQESLKLNSCIVIGRRTAVPSLQPSRLALRMRGIGYLLTQEEVLVRVSP